MRHTNGGAYLQRLELLAGFRFVVFEVVTGSGHQLTAAVQQQVTQLLIQLSGDSRIFFQEVTGIRLA